MSALRLEEVRGEHHKAKAKEQVLAPMPGLLPIEDVLGAVQDRSPASVTLTTLMNRPVYRVTTSAGPILLDGLSGAELSPLPRDVAQQLAQADYAGDGQLADVTWIDTPALEYRGRDLPLWRARFDDRLHTAVYVSPATGDVVARRNDLWRIFDFVWMLHIMDYDEREDFNHPLLIAAAVTALLFTVTGLIMLFYSFRPRPS